MCGDGLGWILGIAHYKTLELKHTGEDESLNLCVDLQNNFPSNTMLIKQVTELYGKKCVYWFLILHIGKCKYAVRRIHAQTHISHCGEFAVYIAPCCSCAGPWAGILLHSALPDFLTLVFCTYNDDMK